MKKILLFCMLVLTLLSACGRDEPGALYLVQTVLDTHSELPSGAVTYHSEALPGEKAYMTPRLRSLLYDDGRMRELPEFERVVDYAVNLSDGQYGMEIHVFRMASQADARNMERLLQRRLDLLKRRSLYLYAPSAYEDYLASSVVAVEDEYVFLLSTGVNDEILDEMRNLL